MTITCVITDDEPMARKGLQSYVERVDFLSLTGVCEDAIQLKYPVENSAAGFTFVRYRDALSFRFGFIGDLKPASQSDRYFRL